MYRRVLRGYSPLNFLRGLLIGSIAKQVFAMISRALPSNLSSRYRVRLLTFAVEEDIAGGVGLIGVRIEEPVWHKRLLKDPRQDLLLAYVRYGDSGWVRTKWDGGDGNNRAARADAAKPEAIVAVSLGKNGGWYLGDRFADTDFLLPATLTAVHPIGIKVVYGTDNRIAASALLTLQIAVSGKLAGELTVNAGAEDG